MIEYDRRITINEICSKVNISRGFHHAETVKDLRNHDHLKRRQEKDVSKTRRSRTNRVQLAFDSALLLLQNWNANMANSLAKVYREKWNMRRKITRMFFLKHFVET